jgi:hypothetical protein
MCKKKMKGHIQDALLIVVTCPGSNHGVKGVWCIMVHGALWCITVYYRTLLAY